MKYYKGGIYDLDVTVHKVHVSFPLIYTSKEVKEFMEKQEQILMKGLAVPPHIIKGDKSMKCQLDHSLNNEHGAAYQFLSPDQKEYLYEAARQGFTIQVFTERGWCDCLTRHVFSNSNVYRVKPEDIEKDLLDHNLNNFTGKKWNQLNFPQHEYIKHAEKLGYSLEHWNETDGVWCSGKMIDAFHPYVAYRVNLREIEQEGEDINPERTVYKDLTAPEKAYLHRMHEEGYPIEYLHPAGLGSWIMVDDPSWHTDLMYRVVPEPVYYFVDQLGAVQSTRDEGLFSDRQHMKVGNYFRKRESAEKRAILVKLVHKYGPAAINVDFKPSWKFVD